MPQGVLYQEMPLKSTFDGRVYIVLPVKIEKVLSDNIINKIPSTLGELDAAFDESVVGQLEKYIQKIWQVKQTPYYSADTILC